MSSVHLMELLLVQVVKIEDSLQGVSLQNGCLKAELRDLQHERDFFMHDVAALRKQLQNVNDKVGRSSIPVFSSAPSGGVGQFDL